MSPEPRGYPGNLGLLFAEHAHEERAALVDLHDAGRPRPVTFRELDALCNAVARGLRRAGLAPGDRIAILSLNRREFVATVLGAMRAGVVPVPINIKVASDTVQYIVNDAGVKLLFAEGPLRRLCPAGVDIVEYGGASFERFVDPGEFEAYDPAPESVAIQPYTSGSTGRPKGVLLTHYGQNWSRRILAHTRGTTSQDVILVAAPLYHKNALNAIKQGLTAGATLLLLPQFKVEQYIEAIGRYRATVISGVPTMMSMVLARKDLLARTDTASVRTIMMGSAPSSAQLLAQLAVTFPNAEPLVVYGVTEGGPVPLGPHPEGKARPPGSIGYPYPGTGARLAGGGSNEGKDDANTEGELVLRNPGVLLAYHNLPDETAARIRDGWYYTGDICRRDREGFYLFHRPHGRHVRVRRRKHIPDRSRDAAGEASRRAPGVHHAVRARVERRSAVCFRRAASGRARGRGRAPAVRARERPRLPAPPARLLSRPASARGNQQDRPGAITLVGSRRRPRTRAANHRSTG